MKKFIACLLALPLTLAACGAQTTPSEPTSAPEVTTEATAESGETTPAETSQTSPTGWLRPCVLEAGGWELDCDDGYYDVTRVWDESTATNTFTVLKTDPANTEQKKVAEFQTQGWIDATAHWGDTVEFYLGEESTEDGGIKYSRCIVDTSTGSVETQPLEGEFHPAWYDDAAVYSEQGKGMFVTALTRLDRATGELTEIAMPGQIYRIRGAVDGRWLLERVNSPEPLPEVATMDDTFTSIWQNSEIEYVLYDAATGDMEKLYTMAATGDMEKLNTMPVNGESRIYLGQRNGSLYFMHSVATDEGGTTPSSIDKLENGTMTPVCEIAAQHDDVKPVIENGELQWVTQMKQWAPQAGDADLYVYDLSTDQTSQVSIQMDAAKVWDTGRLLWLAPDGKLMVTHGSYTDAAGNERTAYALIDRTAYLAGSTDYTPITMYTGD